MELVSCDTFVAMADVSNTNEVVFGKNSDRPDGEVQEVVFMGESCHQKGEKLKCSYIEIDEMVGTKQACILSKPAWMWGAEMGANKAGVVIGNEAVWNRLSDPKIDLVPRLLGMDLLRLGLERGTSASESLSVITDLLETYGQGGQCSDIVPDFSYHNFFLIADGHEAWILETAGMLWVAERITEGVRNISNCMSITTNISKESKGLREEALKNGWWNGKTEFNWTEIIGASTGDLTSPQSRYQCGRRLLCDGAKENKFSPTSMMSVLRDRPSGINRPSGSFPTAASQVSLLSKSGSTSCHWLTATPGPDRSIFKPFRFLPDLTEITTLTRSPKDDNLAPVEREHPLWSCHDKADFTSEVLKELGALEDKYIEEAKHIKSSASKDLFSIAVEEEIALYKN